MPQRLKSLEGELDRDQADFDLAVKLEKVRLDAATSVANGPAMRWRNTNIPAALTRRACPYAPGRHREAAALIQQSPIKEHFSRTGRLGKNFAFTKTQPYPTAFMRRHLPTL